MSVPLDQRHESGIEFIDNARKLFKHTVTYYKKMPKSLRFLITIRIHDLAREVYISVRKANATRPKTSLDVDIRYRHLTEAKGSLEALLGLLSQARYLYNIKLENYAWNEWGRLIGYQRYLIMRVINSDKKTLKEGIK